MNEEFFIGDYILVKELDYMGKAAHRYFRGRIIKKDRSKNGGNEIYYDVLKDMHYASKAYDTTLVYFRAVGWEIKRIPPIKLYNKDEDFFFRKVHNSVKYINENS